MALEPGARINQFEILEQLGSGAMGEVYRARDTRLDRDVAIKVLPDYFVNDTERVRRFEREARTLAALDHPNIGALYDFQEAGGTRFLVMQLIDGETLEERIERGPLPPDEALPIFVQIAQGLEAAHLQGIIHRDLKPGNVKIRPDGSVKVLDFGLAKSFEPDGKPADRDSSVSATATAHRLTAEHALIGTPNYMSPEQARAKDVDRRSDIWAFGCTLFEALTGKPPFEGRTTADLIVRILRESPDWALLPGRVPPPVRTLLKRCLERDPRKRLKDAGDIALALEDAMHAVPMPGDAPDKPAAVAETARSRAFAWTLAGLAIVLAGTIAAVVLGTRKAETSAPGGGRSVAVAEAPKVVRRLSIPLSTAYPIKRPNPIIGDNVFAVSPDGSRLVYVSATGDETHLVMRKLDELEFRPVAGSEGAWNPFFSPDGKWIGFQQRFGTEPRVMKVPVEGGVAVPLAPSPLPLGAAWGEDDVIVFGRGVGATLVTVSADGGEVTKTKLDEPRWKGLTEGFPQVLPGRQGLVFGGTGVPHSDHTELFFADKPGAPRTLIARNVGRSYYVPSGHFVYPRAGVLLALPYDLKLRKPTGPEVPVTEARMASGASLPRQYAFSNRGDLFFVPESVEAESARTIAWVDRSGVETRIPAAARPYETVRIAPDDSMLALDLVDLEDVWIYSLKRGTTQRLTFTQGSDYRPIWEPAGESVIYLASHEGQTAIYQKRADGTGETELWVTNPDYPYPNDISADGRRLIYSPVATTSPVWMIEKGEAGSPKPLFDGKHGERDVRISPDGRWISYESRETGRYEIYVQSFPEAGAKFQVSLSGGEDAVWRRDGKELFFWENKVLMAVEVETEPTFTFGEPKPLFEMQEKVSYDAASDGQRFVVIKEGETSAWATEIVVVENWFEELKRMVPTVENYAPPKQARAEGDS